MRCLEIVCVTTSAAERDAVIAAVTPFCDAPDVDVRIYEHELHPTDLAVHLAHRDEAKDQAGVLGEHIARLMEAHGFVSRARWREVTDANRGHADD